MAQKGRGAVVSDASWCTGPRDAAVRTLTNKQTNKQTSSTHPFSLYYHITVPQSTYAQSISTKLEVISTTRGGTSQNSTDLDSGRRPKLKSEEFCEVPPLVGRQFVTPPPNTQNQIKRCNIRTFYTYWDFGSLEIRSATASSRPHADHTFGCWVRTTVYAPIPIHVSASPKPHCSTVNTNRMPCRPAI